MKELTWNESKITGVHEGDDYYSVEMGSTSFGIDKKHGKIPKVGDMVKWGCSGWGSTIRAVFLNSEKVFFKTDEDVEKERKEWLDTENGRKEKAFEENKEKMNAEYNALPKVFQLRIDRFRAGNSRFRTEYEPYELFVCKEALIVAKHCKTPEKVKEFAKSPYSEQEKVLSKDHSGNTAGCALRLAYQYLERPEMVVMEHGAMVSLVGCNAYGCTHGEDFGKEIT